MFYNDTMQMLLLESSKLLKSRFHRCVDLLAVGADPARLASPISFHKVEGTFD
jgi:hypothetical protein